MLVPAVVASHSGIHVSVTLSWSMARRTGSRLTLWRLAHSVVADECADVGSDLGDELHHLDDNKRNELRQHCGDTFRAVRSTKRH